MIRNLTSHTIQFSSGSSIPPDRHGEARIVFNTSSVLIEGIPVQSQEVLDTYNLPDEEEGIFLIVPSRVRLAFPDRRDLLSVGGTNQQQGIIKTEYLVRNPRRIK